MVGKKIILFLVDLNSIFLEFLLLEVGTMSDVVEVDCVELIIPWVLNQDPKHVHPDIAFHCSKQGGSKVESIDYDSIPEHTSKIWRYL